MRIGCFLLFCGLCRGKTTQELEKNKSEVVEIRCRIVFSGGDLRSRKSFAGPFIRPADCYERLYLLKMRVATPSLRGLETRRSELGPCPARTGNLPERTGTLPQRLPLAGLSRTEEQRGRTGKQCGRSGKKEPFLHFIERNVQSGPPCFREK